LLVYSSPHIILGTKSNDMGWAGHEDCMGEIIEAHWIAVGKKSDSTTWEKYM
jgi:hypothetical protein